VDLRSRELLCSTGVHRWRPRDQLREDRVGGSPDRKWKKCRFRSKYHRVYNGICFIGCRIIEYIYSPSFSSIDAAQVWFFSLFRKIRGCAALKIIHGCGPEYLVNTQDRIREFFEKSRQNYTCTTSMLLKLGEYMYSIILYPMKHSPL